MELRLVVEVAEDILDQILAHGVDVLGVVHLGLDQVKLLLLDVELLLLLVTAQLVALLQLLELLLLLGFLQFLALDVLLLLQGGGLILAVELLLELLLLEVVGAEVGLVPLVLLHLEILELDLVVLQNLLVLLVLLDDVTSAIIQALLLVGVLVTLVRAKLVVFLVDSDVVVDVHLLDGGSAVLVLSVPDLEVLEQVCRQNLDVSNFDGL